jgi:hypothetical protein
MVLQIRITQLPISGNHSYIQKDIECTPKQFTQYCFTDAVEPDATILIV